LKCRHCEEELREKFLDLGVMPPSNAYLSKEDLEKPEPKYPLRLLVCTNCWLVQTEDFVGRDELFTSDYAYFSSTSKSWLKHAADYCEAIISRLRLGPKSLVVEIASNDGYLLKNFMRASHVWESSQRPARPPPPQPLEFRSFKSSLAKN